jgi:type I restriction enzyme S subunit
MQFCKLKDISINGKGQYGISASASPYDPSYPQYIRITDITDDGCYNPSPAVSINPANYPEYENYFLKEGDIVFARTGASTGRNYFYNPSDGKLVYAGFLIKFSIDPQKVLPKYIKYYCQTKEYYDWVSGGSTGSTRQNLNAQDYANLPIPIKTLPEQQHIVNLIGTIDDKIENNEEIIKIGYRYCRAEYKKALLNATYKKFRDVDELSISAEIYKTFNNKLYLDTAAISEQTILWNNVELLSSEKAPSRAKMKPTSNTIWFAKIKNSPKYLLIREYMTEYIDHIVLSTGFMGIKAGPELANIYYHYFSGGEFYRLQNAVCNGVTMEGLSNSLLNSLEIPIFSSSSVIEFNRNCDYIIQNNYNLRQKNRMLQKLKEVYLKKFFG